jgi:hypothetical protein
MAATTNSRAPPNGPAMGRIGPASGMKLLLTRTGAGELTIFTLARAPRSGVIYQER